MNGDSNDVGGVELLNVNIMTEKIFSVIVPVYNTDSNLLERCINSILFQTFSSYELIIVDDGSKQTTADVIDKIVLGVPNCHVYHINNNGVSYARNLGVKQANGEWILFVDSDDVISPYMLEQAYNVIKKHPNIDIVYGLVKYLYKVENEGIENDNCCDYKILSSGDIQIMLMHMVAQADGNFMTSSKGCISRGPVAKIVNRKLALKIIFPLGLRFGEDGIWNLKILMSNPLALVVYSTWYYYIYNSNSVTHRYCESIVSDQELTLKALDDLLVNRRELCSIILLKTIESVVEIIRCYYGHAQYPKGISHANQEFREVIKKSAFSKYSRWKYAKDLSIKNKIKWLILFKSRFPVYAYSYLLYAKRVYVSRIL